MEEVLGMDESSLCYIKIKNKSLKEENERLKAEVNDYLNKGDTAVNEVLRAELKLLKSEYAKLKAPDEYVIKMETMGANHMVDEIRELKEELEASNTENDRLKKDSESADENLIDENDELVSKNTKLKAEIDRLRKIPTIGESEAALKEICYLKAEIDSSHMVNDHRFDEIKELKAEIATLRTGFEHDIFVALEEIHSLKENHKACRDLINSYSDKLSELREEQNLLYDDVDMGSDD